ncbi:hypothetical protein J2I47_23705 [Fibrella sp. HMF5335]|uniref:Uncharacterized protein n=1 Tax=Fibrella rubiginis TaxID=2817060 RepID=A0A939GML6_9BACT|nr:hypothetical protein [Fibrella rubiginis]MBO0939576.1 hypothetical protein [Fibrella rubiginis]
MDMKPATFTLEVKGLTLPDSVREDISLALNATLMRKLGEVDLAGHAAGAAVHEAPGGNIFGRIIRIDGGEIMRLLNRRDFGNVFQKNLENVNVLSAGIETLSHQQRLVG